MKRFLLLFILCQYHSAVYSQSASSPYKLSLNLDIPIAANGVALEGISYLLGTEFTLPPKDSILNLNRNSVNKFDRGATHQNSKIAGYLSDATLYAACGLPLLQLINRKSRNDFGTVAAINAETFVLNLGITDLVKELVKRNRPLLYNPDVPIEKKLKKDNFKSFFSGHTSTVSCMSFCFAKMYADYNPDSKLKPMVWSLCAALPVVTGVLRYKAGKHYWTDVIAGYAAGALVGIVTPYVHSSSLKFNRQ